MMRYTNAILIILLFLNIKLFSQEKSVEQLSFFDNNDSMLDLSNYLSQAYGLLPVPILITEPAIGYGGGAALIYLHDKFGSKKSKSGRNIPASMSGAILAGTENKTYIGALFHLGYYLDDTIRTQSVAGVPNVNINFYTQNQEAVFMNLKGIFAYQSLKYRLFDSNFFIGTSYLYSQLENSIKNNDSKENISELQFKNSAISALFDYDSRDNTLSPNSGMIFNVLALFFDKNLGGDYTFQRYLAQELLYIPVTSTINFDQRLSYAQIVGKEAPFYLYPSINLRGVPAMKYQGEKNILYEAQVRWEFIPRWSALAFGGVAKAYGKDKFFPEFINISFEDANSIWTKGIGFRYLIAKKFGLRMGVDIASSNEDEAFYIQFGTAWMGL